MLIQQEGLWALPGFLFCGGYQEWQISWRKLKEGKRGKRERKILGRQDERLGWVPGCHLAKYVWQSFLPRSLLAICRTVMQVASSTVHLQTLLFVGLPLFPWWIFPSSRKFNPVHKGLQLLSVLPNSCFYKRETSKDWLSPEDHERDVHELCGFPIFRNVFPASRRLSVFSCFQQSTWNSPTIH